MPLHKIGRVGIVFYSEWEENRVYSYLDYVRTGGNCYMCVAEHLSDELNKPKDGADSTFWRVVVDNSTTKLELLQNIDEKFETTKAELRAYIGEVMANLNKAVIVDTLPDTGEIGTLYLVANGGSDDNLYDEYIYINKGSEANPNFVFEKLGIKEIDLSGAINDKIELVKQGLKDEILGEVDDKLTNLNNATQPELTQIDEFKLFSTSVEVNLEASQRKNLQPSVSEITDGGYEIVAYKQISFSRLTNGDESWENIILQSFSTANNSTTPNISVYNIGTTTANFKVVIIMLCKRTATKAVNVIQTNENLTQIQEKVTTLENKISVLTNFDGLALPLTLKSPNVTYAELQAELDTLTNNRYSVVENSLQTGMSMSGHTIGTVEVIDNETNERFRLMISFASA